MTTIWVTGEFEGWHYWPGAPQGHEYLAEKHRHIFKVRLELEVTDLNRETEFIQLKRKLLVWCVNTFGLDTTTFSCEQMCEQIAVWARDYNLDPYSVTVSEDGENGATWYRD